MTFKMTRRGFGAALTVAAIMPSVALGQGSEYAFPQLLQTVADLLPRVGEANNGRPAYEADGMILVDVRERDAFDAGHIPGARHLDPNAVVAGEAPISGELKPEAELVDLLEELGVTASTRVVFYDDRGGFHAARMFWLLEYLGHRDVAVLNGGYSAWVAADGAVATDSAETPRGSFSAAPLARRLATADYILAHQHDENTVVIDVRPPKMYAEGHIPWAKSIPWSQNLGEDGNFLSAADLRAHFEANGVTPDKNVVIHCQVGLASSHSYVALRLLGYPRVRVYHRSWADWGADPALPSKTGA